MAKHREKKPELEETEEDGAEEDDEDGCSKRVDRCGKKAAKNIFGGEFWVDCLYGDHHVDQLP